MILQWFAEMIYKVITGLLSWVNIPSLDESIITSITTFIDDVIGNGVAIFKLFIPSVLSRVGIPIVLIIVAFKYGYYFVMFILKKIPMASIS